MSGLPLNWSSSKLEELFIFVVGGDWGKDSESADEDYVDVLCIRGSEFKHWKTNKGKTASVRRIKKSSLETRKLYSGDILIEISGGGPDQPVGRTVLIDDDSLAHHKELDKVCTNFLRLARPSSHINSAYLNYYLQNFYNTGEITNYQGGSNNLRNLKFKEYVTISIPIAPLNEQIRIADKLDRVLAKVDAAQARLEKIPTLLKRFRQSVLAAATSGELTREWRENERGENIVDLVDQISKARVAKWEQECQRTGRKRKYKVPETSNFDALPSIPSNWVWASVDSVSFKVVDGVHKKPDYQSTGIPFITVRNLTAGPGISFKNLNYVSEDDHQEFYQRANPEKGDILISKDGTLGVVRQIKTDDVFSIFVSVALVKPVLQEISNYLEIAFSAPVVQKQMVGVGTGLQHIHLTDLKKDMIPLPPLKEQKEIVRRVESLFTLADTVEKQHLETKKRIDRLTQSLLAKAFRGELMPQDPSDEPAAELLKRIQAERNAQPPVKNKRAKSA